VPSKIPTILGQLHFEPADEISRRLNYGRWGSPTPLHFGDDITHPTASFEPDVNEEWLPLVWSNAFADASVPEEPGAVVPHAGMLR
jgi:hypothetical protein